MSTNIGFMLTNTGFNATDIGFMSTNTGFNATNIGFKSTRIGFRFTNTGFKQEGNADPTLKPDFYIFLLTFATQMNVS